MKAQRVLSIEVKHEIKTIKLFEGQTITYQLKGSDEWYEDQVQQFLVNDSTILFQNSMLHIRDLHAIRINNSVAKGISKTLIAFGSAWLLYGGIAHYTSSQKYKFTWGTFATGATAIGVGILTAKISGQKKYKANSNARFRLLDLNFIEAN